MRFYRIVIKNASGKVVVPASQQGVGDGSSTYASQANGVTLPGALNIELDIPIASWATPAGAAFVKVWGVSLAEISQAADLEGLAIEVYGGMAKGLPLAKPEQAGLLVSGVIAQSFGNWAGIEMSLDLVLQTDGGTIEEPKNLVLNWAKGSPLSGALQSTLTNAFSGASSTINVSPEIVAPENVAGYYATMTQLNAYLSSMSKGIVKTPNYAGVQIYQNGTTFRVYDGTTKNAPKAVAFEDLIGQPTWINPGIVQFKTVMRADVVLDDYITLPQGIQTTSTAAGTPPFGSGIKQKSAFQGSFQVIEAHVYGDFRSPPAESWNSTFNVAAELP